MKKKFADGVRFFERKDNQPDFVLGALVISPDKLQVWAEANPDLCSDYKGETQIKFQVKRSKDGKVYIDLDTWKKGATSNNTVEDELPF